MFLIENHERPAYIDIGFYSLMPETGTRQMQVDVFAFFQIERLHQSGRESNRQRIAPVGIGAWRGNHGYRRRTQRGTLKRMMAT